MKKYNLSEIMHKAWKLYRKGTTAFAECLHRAWNSAKALFQVVLIHSSKGDGQTYRASFFAASQVKPLNALNKPLTWRRRRSPPGVILRGDFNNESC